MSAACVCGKEKSGLKNLGHGRHGLFGYNVRCTRWIFRTNLLLPCDTPGSGAVGRGLQPEDAVVVFARSCGSVCNKPPTHRGPLHALMGSRLSLRCVMREIHRKVMRINLPTTKHSTSEIVLLVSVFPPPIEYPVRGDA